MKHVLVAALALAACHSPTAAQPGAFPVPLVAEAPPDDEVVATVDGRPIRQSDVARQARARGVDARQALADLVDAEVLAGEAARRGLDRDRDAVEAARSEAVRRLLETTFEKEVTPAGIPTIAVRRLYHDNRNILDHDTSVDVWHILVPVDKKFTPEQKAEARAAAEDLARRARGVPSAEAFQALAATVKAPAPARYEHVVTEKNGWTLHEFSYPAFEQLHAPGDTTGVVETEYGYHVLYLNRYWPPVHVPLEKADGKLRDALFPEFQRREFLHFADRMAGSHEVVERAERLAQVK